MNCRYNKYSTTCAICQIYIYNAKSTKHKKYSKNKNNAIHKNDKKYIKYINGKKIIEYKNHTFYKNQER